MEITWDWKKLTGNDWCQLLYRYPRFAGKCDWRKLSGFHWRILLRKYPLFAKQCDWDKLDGPDWCSLLCRHPRFHSVCNWETLDGRDWVILLCIQPQFSCKCDWSKLSDKDWEILFSKSPSFKSEYWNGQHNSDRSWQLRHYLIKTNPFTYTDDEKDEEKEKWDELDGQDWSWLLRERPGFSARCKWGKLNGGDWSWLLREQPQLADRCDWRKFRECDWDFLLSAQPQFSGKYEIWKKNRCRPINDARFVQTLIFHAEGRNIAFPTEEKNGTDEVLEESSFCSKNTSEEDESVKKCGWPRKLDNLTWCKMPVKLTWKGRAFL